MENNSRKNVISNILKWIIILVLLVIVYFWKNDVIKDAFREMRSFPVWVALLCFTATFLYFVIEGIVIHDMTMYETRRMSWWEGFKCGLYCAFFKLISLGSLSGLAEVYYISKHDIDIGRAGGITLIQYAYQKFGITILGTLSFIILYISGISTVHEYARWGVLGTVVALGIVTFLIIIAASKKAVSFLEFLLRKLIGSEGLIKNIKGMSLDETRDELTDKLHSFNEAGQHFLSHKDLSVKVILFLTLKMALWYSIAGITVFASGITTKGSVSVIEYFFLPLLLMTVANMIGTVMVAPAGAGTLEFVVSLLFVPLFGNTAATVAILYRFFSLVVPFFFGIFIFAMENKKRRS